MTAFIGRRAFITLLGGAAAARPLVARAQQGERVRQLGVLMPTGERDPETQLRVGAFREGLQKLGWMEGRNLRVEYRWGGGSLERTRTYAAELVALKPDVIFGAPTSAAVALYRETRTIPVVFAQVPDPVGGGGVGVVCGGGGGGGEATAPSFRVQVLSHPVRDAEAIERSIETFVAEPNGGLLLPPGAFVTGHRDLIISLAARHRLPSIFPFRYYVAGGGLASYGVDNLDLYRRAAGYVDRVLKGETPANLPVQFADKFELVINLKTAKAFGLEVPVSLLARTDEVIE